MGGSRGRESRRGEERLRKTLRGRLRRGREQAEMWEEKVKTIRGKLYASVRRREQVEVWEERLKTLRRKLCRGKGTESTPWGRKI